MDLVEAEQATPDALSSEIEAALRLLAGKLQLLIYKQRHSRPGGAGGDNILLDVEFGEVRLLAMWRGCPSPMSLLSPREQEIARMVAQGYANKTIASVLEISSWTVASHLRRIFVKLQVSSRAAMVSCLLGTELNSLPTALEDAADAVIGAIPHAELETSKVSSRILLARS